MISTELPVFFLQCFYDDLKNTGVRRTAVIRSRYIFVIGAHYSTEKETYLSSHLRLTANSVTIHPQYDAQTKVNDIALVLLTRSVDLTDKTIGFICLPMPTLRYPKVFPPDRADAVRIAEFLSSVKFSLGGDRLGTCA